MNDALPSSGRPVSIVELGSLLYLGAVWGAVFLFMRVAAPEVGPVWAAEIRLLVGAVVLIALFGPRTVRAARGRVVPLVVVGATFSAIPFTLISFATTVLPAGFAALLNAATPLFTAVVAVAFLGQRLVPRAVVGLAVGVLAVVVLVGWSPLEPTGTLLLAVAAGLGAPASYAVAGNVVRARLTAMAPSELATAMLAIGAVLLLPVAVLSGRPGTPDLGGVASLVAVGTASTAFAWPVFFRVLRTTSATAASTVTFVVPGFAIAWAAIALDEPIGVNLVAGFGLILLSLGLLLDLRPRLPLVVRSRRLAWTPTAG